MAGTARRAATATIVVIAIVAVALALWKLKVMIALLLLGFIIAAAMRPGIEWLHRRRVPRSVGLALHYLVLAGVIALLLWLVVPRAITQTTAAIGSVPTSSKELKHEAAKSTGIKHEVLVGIQKRLQKLPSGGQLVHPAITITLKAFEILIGIFLTFAVAAYWIFERSRTVDLVVSLLPRHKRRVVRDTWDLIDLKLGAYVRGSLVLVAFVATSLSIAFWIIGLPYWLLVGIFAGLVEMVPIIGPLSAGALAVGVGLTVSWHTALAAGVAVFVLRMAQDYLIVPRVMGHVVGLSPLLVLVSVTAIGLLLGGFYVLLATPVTAVVATLVDVFVRNKDPAHQEVPAVLFPAKDAEG
jgi:predicted PurR-regulated permease PerM